MVQDAGGRLHDALGRFARSGAIKVELEGPRLRKVHAQPGSEARRRWDSVRSQAKKVDEALAQYAHGQRVAAPELIFHRGKYARPEVRHESVLGRPDALENATSRLRGIKGAAVRYETKRAFNGKGLAVRGWKPREFPDGWTRGFGRRTRVLNGAGKKPTRRARDVFATAAKAAAYRPRHGAPDESD